MRSNEELVRHLVRDGSLRTPGIIAAFRRTDRAEFVPARAIAYQDSPVSIGHGATISQPTVVAFMLELLAPRRTDRVLDVGAGSGYTAALLSRITRQVHAVEIEPALVEYANGRLAGYGVHVELRADGMPELAPFDRILVSASAQEVPQHLLDQLADGGVMVIPIRTEVQRIEKRAGRLQVERYPGFAFVPLRATSA